MLLGGGTVLYPLLQRAEVRAVELVDVFDLPETNMISATHDTISVGAMLKTCQPMTAPMPPMTVDSKSDLPARRAASLVACWPIAATLIITGM